MNTQSQWAAVTLATIPGGTTLAPRAFYLLGLSTSGLAAPPIQARPPSMSGVPRVRDRPADRHRRREPHDRQGRNGVNGDDDGVHSGLHGPRVTIPPGSTMVPVTSAAGFAVGQRIGIDTGGHHELATVTAVGKAATQTTLSSAVVGGRDDHQGDGQREPDERRHADDRHRRTQGARHAQERRHGCRGGTGVESRRSAEARSRVGR